MVKKAKVVEPAVVEPVAEVVEPVEPKITIREAEVSVFSSNGDCSRTYSKDIDGKDYGLLAEMFAKKVSGHLR